jgi:hypothetical protein
MTDETKEALVDAAIGIAADLAKTIFRRLAQGDDWEPIINLLPNTEQVKWRHALEEEKARQELQRVHDKVNG